MRSDCSSICEWYAMKYINLVFRWLNMTVHNFDKNLRFRSNMIIFNKSQSTTFKRFNKVILHCSANYLTLFDIKMTRLKNLQMINMKMSKSSIAKSDKISIKFIVMIWKDIDEIKISWRKSYDWCFRIWKIKHFE